MKSRTSKKTVTFTKSFVLGGFDEVLPAGVYSVETDEELLEGLSFPAYRRVSALIQLQAMPGSPGLMRTLTIDPNDLDAALKRDQAPADTSIGRDASQKTPAGSTKSCREEADCLAIERGEDEGMILNPR